MTEILNNGVVVDKNHYYTNGELDDLKNYIIKYKYYVKQNNIKISNQKIQNLMKRR